jgi:hypothetical protein
VYSLDGHDVKTAFSRGWASLLNGDLIRAAEAAGFDLLITTDKGFRYQQNWSERTLSLMILSTNDWKRLQRATKLVLPAVNEINVSSILEIEIPA